MKDVQAALDLAETQEGLAAFIAKLRKSLVEQPGDWQSLTLHDYLESLEAWVDGMDGWATNQGVDLEGMTTWRTFAVMLYAASIYE